jgi:hypothetical protein
MGTGLTNVLILFVLGFVVGYVVTRRRPQATRVQAGLLLGAILFVTPFAASQLPWRF